MSSADADACNFAPAAPNETVVYGACRPGYGAKLSNAGVESWLATMRTHGVERVVCLLDDRHLRLYDDLLGSYRGEFGDENVRHAPIPDYEFADPDLLATTVLPFLNESSRAGKRVVVHCSAGSGRTGHVLATWLAVHRGDSPGYAVETVRATGRNPLEAGSMAEFERLVAAVREQY